LRCVHRELSRESPGERILKIGSHLPKLLSNISAVPRSAGETLFLIGCVSVSITLFFLLGHHYETSEINSQWFRDHAIKFLAKFLGHNLDNLAKNVTTGKATRPKGLQNDASAGLPDPTSA